MSSPYPPEVQDLSTLYRKAHNALNKHRLYLTKGKKAQVDWKEFGKSLGADFFKYVMGSGRAAVLINTPPKYLQSDGAWSPDPQPKIENVEDLFARGVSQVRNNIEHAGKFLTEGTENERGRSLELTREALWIMREAIQRHPDKAKIFSDLLK
jgi:hypothetical protein